MGILCARWVGSTGEVIGFETLPHNVEIVRKNIELNRIENFEIRCEAVGNKNGTVRFRGDSNGAVTESAGPGTIQVPVVSLDEVFRSEKPMFLKIDVEGYEIEVLRGAREVLRSLPRLDLEIHPLLFTDPKGDVERLFALLPLDCYEVFLQTGFNLELVPYKPEEHTPEMIAAYDKVNLFARPIAWKNGRQEE